MSLQVLVTAGAACLGLFSNAMGQVEGEAEPDQRCLECHGQAHIAELGPQERLSMVGTWLGAGPAPEQGERDAGVLDAEAPATRPELFVQADAVSWSVHAGITCVECHEDADRLPHEFQLNLDTCAAACHSDESDRYEQSMHKEAFGTEGELAPTCVSCHGGHEILAVADRQSPQHRLNSIFLCAECHEKHENGTPNGHEPGPHMEAYFKSTHGKAVVESGLVAAPTCVDCHASHEVHPADDERSLVHRSQVPATCGGCHVGILSTFKASVHGQLFNEGDEEGPVCTDCHNSHEIRPSDEVAFKLHSDERCGACHEDRLERYRETFHGKALALGRSGVAACYDCHGHHDIVSLDDPESRLAGQKKLETCQQCHPDAGKMFAGYIAHADHYDRADYPVLFWTFVFMTTLVVGTFAFFGVHTFLWLSRTVVLYLHDPRAFREAKAKIKSHEGDEVFIRFRPFDRFLHVLVVISFLLLVATGMPLKFYDAGWARTMVGWAGGQEAAAQLHRLGAIITFLYFGLHLSNLLHSMVLRRAEYKNPKTGRFSLKRYLQVVFGPDMPFPTVHDVRDFWAHQKWFFGRGPRPQFDRWTYWEKFDYLAVFWGVAIIGLSGLVMWFPEEVTRVMPGWSINVALIVHSDEALLAAGFIFTFHFFNVHFRPEKFPIDPVIFSGRISKAELLHERRRWYDRLAAAGRLDTIRMRDEWQQWRRVMHPLGYLAFGTGLVLLGMILYAMGVRLIGGHP